MTSKQLILAEKPSVARDYARILGCNQKSDGYIEGPSHIITWAFGHLCTLKDPGAYKSDWGKWDLNQLPMIPDRFQIAVNNEKGAKAQFKVIQSLVKSPYVSSVVIGTDAGREGELIARFILQAAGNKKPLQRLWVSTLTDADLKKGFANLESASKYDNLYDAAFSRAKIDWLIGMNITRLMTLTSRTTSSKQVISVGRVQTPVLNLIVSRDHEIDHFQSEPFFEVSATFALGYAGKHINDQQESKIPSETDAKQIASAVKNKPAVIASVTTEAKSKPAPQLFDLTSLQRTTNRKHGFSAQKTLDIAQSLYEETKILSYPRTSSRYLSESMKPELAALVRRLNFGPFASHVQTILNHPHLLRNEKRFINDTEITDHHAIIVTNTLTELAFNKLTPDQKLVFTEVANVFLGQFMDDYLYNSTTIVTECEKHLFKSTGTEEVQKGWRVLFGTDDEEDTGTGKGKGTTKSDPQDQMLPRVNQGERTRCIAATVLSKKTKPPARMTEDSLLNLMEKNGLGTPATRAGILETLLSRKFIQRQKKQLVSTDVGKQFISVVDERLKSVELTAEMEAQLEQITKGTIRADAVMANTISRLVDDIKQIKQNGGVGMAPKPAKESIGKCPCCGNDVVETPKAYVCEGFSKNECTLAVWKYVAGTELPVSAMKELLLTGITTESFSFISKLGKPFKARLKLEGNKAVFDFDKK